MDWKQLLVAITRSVDYELRLRNEYLATENRTLRNQSQERVQLRDGDRQALAERDQKLGKQALEEVATLVRLETILAWHRKLVGRYQTGRARARPDRTRRRCGIPPGPAPVIPGEEALRVPGWSKVLPGEHRCSIPPQQEGALGPFADEVLVVEPLF